MARPRQEECLSRTHHPRAYVFSAQRILDDRVVDISSCVTRSSHDARSTAHLSGQSCASDTEQCTLRILRKHFSFSFSLLFCPFFLIFVIHFYHFFICCSFFFFHTFPFPVISSFFIKKRVFSFFFSLFFSFSFLYTVFFFFFFFFSPFFSGL